MKESEISLSCGDDTVGASFSNGTLNPNISSEIYCCLYDQNFSNIDSRIGSISANEQPLHEIIKFINLGRREAI
jgi:hypothetical protein